MRSIYTEAFNIARTNDTWIDDGFVRGEKLSRDMQHGQEMKWHGDNNRRLDHLIKEYPASQL